MINWIPPEFAPKDGTQILAAFTTYPFPVMAVWCGASGTWCAGPKGGVVPIPRSISYAKADQEEFTRYHYLVIGFLRGPHAATYLWKHLGEMSHDMMNTILDSFGE